jgi:signal transduction histidine kinase
VHFDNPAFRGDALRAIGNTARRIDEMIARLSALRYRPEFVPEKTDISRLVAECVESITDLAGVELARDLQSLPPILVDREHIRSVITNLIINARDATGPSGRILVSTAWQADRAVVTVSDNGCGMTAEFVENSLFRPFQSTKKDGLGIGMFQARMVVEAHRGTIGVESTPGKGTTIRLSFPGKAQA